VLVVCFENQVSFDEARIPVVDQSFDYFAQRSGVTTDQTLVDIEVIRAAGVEQTDCAV
jgi:hypothetical protein